MEEIMAMIFNGINLVKELEFSLSSQDSPEFLSNSLGSISTLFGDANQRLNILLARRNSLVPNQPEREPIPMSGLDQMLQITEPDLMQDYWLRHTLMETTTDFAADSSFSTPRPRRRKKYEEEETVLVAAVGRMEIPPDDNYTWRKYGQKDILGSRFPR